MIINHDFKLSQLPLYIYNKSQEAELYGINHYD